MPALTDLDAAVDRLYQEPLERFVAERNALAAEWRKAGNRSAADSLKGLAKPSATAWAVNQAWWQHHDAVRAMLAAGEHLTAAQESALRGAAADLRAAMQDRQRAIDIVVDAAVAALGGPAVVTADARHRIAGTCNALATSGFPAGVKPGRLVSDLQSTGLDVLSALAASLPAGAAAAPRRPASPPPAIAAVPPKKRTDEPDARAREDAERREARVAEAEAQVRAKEREAREAEAAEARAEAAATRAAQARERAAAKVEELEAALAGARDAFRAAQRAAAEASRAVDAASEAHERAERSLTEARQRWHDAKAAAKR